ncbi:MAG: NADH-quinone oxidoreductase subunit L [Chloroflexi bacterium]|nr:NADH-quinone oxidoreductase subunit L [Chloroflexota bacterium]
MTIYDTLQGMAETEHDRQAQFENEMWVCLASGCASQNADQLADRLADLVKEQELEEKVNVKCVGCMGLCATGPHVTVKPAGQHYSEVRPEDAEALVEAAKTGEPYEPLYEPEYSQFFDRQTRIVLENAGSVDPESLEDYLVHDGYKALNIALTEMSPDEIIQEITNSGLRGRGGGGYPTGLKWSTVAKAESDTKYVICNADEGDPGAFMDRSVLESDPYRILEGMTIAAFAVGASKGHIYVRAEYPLAIDRLNKAIRRAKRENLLGNEILGTPFNFSIEIRLGAGAFVCGEETALIASIEGKRGQPRPRPPYPADYGLWGEPTLINNVETLANIAPIIRNGSDWYASFGTESSKGTKVFALTGQVNNTGLIEVPMGITLREIVYDIGGGAPDGRAVKAVQTGGPSGGCIPEHMLDLPVDFESLREVGSMMGSGGMIVMDDTASMLEVARFFMEFSMTESCGKCIPCRVGTKQMYDLLGRIESGVGTYRDLQLLRELCDVTQHTSLCGLGQSAPNPVLSTLHFFEDEYLSLLTDVEAAAD